MNFENLKKSCRICLQEGNMNVWLHRVELPPTKRSTSLTASGSVDADIVDTTTEYDDSSCKHSSEENTEQGEIVIEEIAVQTMLQIFGAWECREMQLICESCLDDLLSFYMYYKKILAANKRIKRLYKEALWMANDDDVVDFKADILHVEQDDEEEVIEDTSAMPLQRHLIETVEEVNTQKDIKKAAERSCETVNTNEPCSLAANKANACKNRCTLLQPVPKQQTQQTSYKNKPTRNPKIILTGGVSQILTHVNENCFPDISGAAKRSMCNVVTQPQKRQRTSSKCEMESNSTPLERGLFVTKFIPSTNAIHCDVRNVEAHGKEMTETLITNELRTMDFKAVQFTSHNMQDIVEEDELTARLEASCDATGASVTPVYACKYCPQAYAMAQYLIAHVRKSHVCKFCTQAFLKTTDLYEHIKQAHQQHKCAICSKVLSTHSNLRGHIKRMHGLKLPAQVALLDFKPFTELLEIEGDDVEINNQIEIVEDGSDEYAMCIEELQE